MALTKKQIIDKAVAELHYQMTRAYWGNWNPERGWRPPWDTLNDEFGVLAMMEWPPVDQLVALGERMVKAGGSRNAHRRLLFRVDAYKALDTELKTP